MLIPLLGNLPILERACLSPQRITLTRYHPGKQETCDLRELMEFFAVIHMPIHLRNLLGIRKHQSNDRIDQCIGPLPGVRSLTLGEETNRTSYDATGMIRKALPSKSP